MLESEPPMRSIPAGLCQDTCSYRPTDREWDCSHSPSKLRQLVSPVKVSVSQPPHAVSDDWVCPDRPGGGSLGSRQLRSPGSHTSALWGPSPSLLRPPVNRSPGKKQINFSVISNYANVNIRWGHPDRSPPIELVIIYVCLGTYTRLSMPFPAPQFNPNERVGCFNNFRMSHDIAYCNL